MLARVRLCKPHGRGVEDSMIEMEIVIKAFRFLAENRSMSTPALTQGLKELGAGWTFEDWHAQFGKEPKIELFEGMRLGSLSTAASVIINMSKNAESRYFGDIKFLSVDDDTSIYHFVRIVTGDDSFTKANIINNHN